MDTSKLKEAIAEAEAQAAKYRRLADDLKAALARASEDGGVRLPLRRTEGPIATLSTLRAAIAALAEKRGPVHITDLVGEVSKRRGKDTPRASLESVLAIAIKQGKYGLRRTAPGTFEVVK